MRLNTPDDPEYRAPRGSTLTFRVTATDAAGNRSRARSARTLVPLDQTGRRLRLDSGWQRAVRGRHRLQLLAQRGVRLDAVAVRR